MKILMISSEFRLVAKTGGLADAVETMSHALADRGHEVQVFMPRYGSIDLESEECCSCDLENGGEIFSLNFTVHHLKKGLDLIFVENEDLFGNREGIYGEEGKDYFDNSQRFTVFGKAPFSYMNASGWKADILHAHDWPAALSCLYLERNREIGRFTRCQSMYSVHNLGYQGQFPLNQLSFTGLSMAEADLTRLLYNGHINFMAAALHSADLIGTVSENYAKEILKLEYSFGMEPILQERIADIRGILNGMDYDEWNPATDPHISHNFDSSSVEKKALVKQELQKEFGLEEDPQKPLIGMVGRLVHQKGIEELLGPHALEKILFTMDVQVVIVGSGYGPFEKSLEKLAKKHKNLSLYLGYSERLAHLVEAGSDFFLMPSRYEPCGLNQMYSLRYGTLPIVRNTGGLADTVVNYNQDTGEGTGFMFDTLSEEVIYDVVGWAVWAFYNRPQHIHEMRIRAMEERFTWEKSAEKYEQCYKELLN
jgi:starch synthase